MKRQKVRLAVLDVGQGDTLVVSQPDAREAVVVDCVSAIGVFDYLKSQSVHRVRALIVTHLHSDHYRQALAFLSNCERQLGQPCERVILNPLPEEEGSLPPPDEDGTIAGQGYDAFAHWMLQNASRVYSPHPSPRLPIAGPLAKQIEFIYPYPGELPFARAAGYNNSSLILRVRGVGASALLAGDIEPAGWAILKRRAAARAAIRAEVLKFPHHGAWKRDGSPADAAAFLQEVGAKTVVISVGSRQPGYAHPDSHVFAALRDNAQVLCTQATAHCGLSAPEAERDRTLSVLRPHLELSEIAPVFCQSGTPCAGTVVIDLDQVPSVIAPEPNSHWRQVVKTSFAAKHQCRRG